MNLYLNRSGRLRRHDNTLSFETVSLPPNELGPDIESPELEEAPRDNQFSLPVETVDAVYVFGEISINSKLMNFLAQKEIPVHFFNYYGNHSGSFLPHAQQLSGDLVIRQADAFSQTETRLHICKQIISASIHNLLSVVNYYARRKSGLKTFSDQIASAAASLDSARSTDEVMGVEGSVRKLYYQAWPLWLGSPASHFKRIYHPPDSPLNATVSFVNSLLYTACVSELYRTALYPGISFLHAPQSRRFSLALDIVEPFKPILADRLIFRLWNSRLISDSDFLQDTNGFILTDPARKKILAEWDALLKQTLHLDSLNRSVSYRQLIRIDCYKLVKFLMEKCDYNPFRMEY